MSLSSGLLAAILLIGVLFLMVVALALYLVRIVETNLTGVVPIHMDFSAQVELPPACPDHQVADAPVILFLHETLASGRSYTKYLGFLEALGYRVLAPDLTELDPGVFSPGLGIFLSEAQIAEGRGFLREAVEAARGAPVILFGVSRGASLAAVLGSGPEAPVGALILDGFFSPREVLEAQIRRFAPIYLGRMHQILPRWFRRFTGSWGLGRMERRLGMHFPETLPFLQRVEKPILFLHGGRDRTAPGDFLEEYARGVLGPTEIVILPKARHNQGSSKDPERYQGAVRDFLGRYGLGLPEGSPA